MPTIAVNFDTVSFGKSIASEFNMPTSALYQWSVAGGPVVALVDLPLVDLLAAAADRSPSEVGGLLFGSFDGKYTIINDFELIECEHRRGVAYSLSSSDEKNMAAAIAGRKKASGAVVGFFRSHRRPGMYLDESDYYIISSYFHAANQLILLVKPAVDGNATGGFFFWEEGEINRKQTYLPFPMSSRELEVKEFPMVGPAKPPAQLPLHGLVDAPETIETMEMTMVPKSQETLPPKPRPLNTDPTSKSRRARGTVIGLVAAGAAIGGYWIGTLSHGNAERRSGDIYLYPTQPPPPPPAQPKSATKAPAPSQNETPSTAGAASPPPNQPSGDKPARVANADKPSPFPKKQEAELRQSARASNPPLTPSQLPGAPAPAPSTEVQTRVPPLSNPPALATVRPAPEQLPVALPPRAESTVYLEVVEDGGLKHAMSKVPVLGSFHRYRGGENFTPPKPLRERTPTVPAGLAAQLTGTLPIDLKLNVDENGRVSGVELLSSHSSPDFVRLAGDAAYEFQFEPARMKDKAVPSDIIAHFRFRPIL